MFTHQSFSILFFILKKRQKLGVAPLFVRITINGERKEFSANRNVPLSQWDAKLQRVKGSNSQSQQINTHLDAIKTSLNLHHSRLITLGKVVSAQMLKNEYLGNTDDRKSLCEAFEFLINRKRDLVKKKLLSATTLEKYEKTYEYVVSFIKAEYKTPDMSLHEIAPSFIEDFAHYLLTAIGLANNTAMKKVAQAKSVFIMAHGRGWINKNPAALYLCSYDEDDPERLEIDELYTLCTKEISIRRLEVARDCYTFMCFTGYAYKDANGLGRDNIFIGPDGNEWITKDREKTDNTECVPLLPNTKRLIEKYRNHPDCLNAGKLLPIKSNQKFNAYLKEIAAICGINKELTTHTARHTFATTVTLENGVPLETVGKMLGHKKIATTQKYAKVTRKKIRENMDELQWKND